MIWQQQKAIAMHIHEKYKSYLNKPKPTVGIAVDCSIRKNPGEFEYRGINISTGEILFSGGYHYGTNNIAEFLAIVHALKYCKENKLYHTIYSDSQTALCWVASKNMTMRDDIDDRLKDCIMKSMNYLKTVVKPNYVTKWDTRRHGEIPADYGRKPVKKHQQ